MTHRYVPPKKKLFETKKVTVQYVGSPIAVKYLSPVEKSLTKRARRLAKKLFKKQKHSLGGYTRHEYQKPVLPPEIIRWYKELDERAQKLFKRNYSNLKDHEKSKLHNSMNE